MKKRGAWVIISIVIILVLIVVAVSLFFLLKSDKRVTCETIECFEENFNKCNLAIWDNSYSQDMTSYFEILGKENGLCKLKQVMSTPQTGELEQICKVDNSLGLEYVMSSTNADCEGSLYDYTKTNRDALSSLTG